MGLIINQNLVNEENARTLVDLCPFKAISYENGKLDINAGCKLCKMCVNKGPKGVVSFVEDKVETINKDEYKGICVYADNDEGQIHKVTYELIGEAKKLASIINHPVYVLLIGSNCEENAKDLLEYGVDKVFVYDNELLSIC